jgi:hypothetical protein
MSPSGEERTAESPCEAAGERTQGQVGVGEDAGRRINQRAELAVEAVGHQPDPVFEHPGAVWMRLTISVPTFPDATRDRLLIRCYRSSSV